MSAPFALFFLAPDELLLRFKPVEADCCCEWEDGPASALVPEFTELALRDARRYASAMPGC